MEGLSLNLPLLLKTVNHILVSPTNLVRQPLQIDVLQDCPYQARKGAYLDCAVLAAGLQPEHTESFGNNHPLLPVVGRGDTLKELEALKSSRTASCLVGNHTADGPVEDLRWCAVVEGAGLFGVHDMALVKEVVVAQLNV